MRRRWSNRDHNFGPFTFAFDGGRCIGVMLDSGGEDNDGCSLRLSAFGATFIAMLPQWVLRPYARRYNAPMWDADTVARMGRDWYEINEPREYGFSFDYGDSGSLALYFGRQTGDSSTTQDWYYALPFMHWRFVRFSLLNLTHEVYYTSSGTSRNYDMDRIAEDGVEKITFEFRDFDGERITATCHIEEREWRFGTGAWKWLSWFRSPRIRRSLDIDFSKEVGPKKGSWKGGIVGHSVSIGPGEPARTAFARYCAEHNLTLAHLS